MMWIIGVTLVLVAAVGTVVALTPSPERQAVTLSLYALVLTLLFFELSAPDVALSQLGIGTAVVPLIVMLAVRKIARMRARTGTGDRERRTPR
jgi:uncharacterized MnhB-related membrane protein